MVAIATSSAIAAGLTIAIVATFLARTISEVAYRCANSRTIASSQPNESRVISAFDLSAVNRNSDVSEIE